MNQSKLHVLVAGGGISGLALAIGLRHHQHRVTVVERRTPPLSGNGLVLAPNGVKALTWLDHAVAAEVRAAGVPSGGLGQAGHRSAFVTASGAELGDASFDGVEERWGAPIISIRHGRLLEVLRARAESLGAEVIEGRVVEGFHQDPDGVTLDAGETLRGDLLVGADGLHSPTRVGLLGAGAPRFCGVAAVRGFGPRPAERPDGFIAYGCGTVLFVSPVDDAEAYWVASMRAPRRDTLPDPVRARDAALHEMRDWRPELRRIVEQSAPETLLTTDVYDRPRAPRWHEGRVVLIGDAVHPMIYTLGQGANVALEDAATLVHALRDGPVANALSWFEADRADRAATIASQSRTIGRIAHVGWPLCGLRNLMMRVMMGMMDQDRANAEVFGWSPPPRRPTERPVTAR